MALKILLLPTPQPDVELQSEVGPRHKEFGGGVGFKEGSRCFQDAASIEICYEEGLAFVSYLGNC